MEVVVRGIYFTCEQKARDFSLQTKQVAFCYGEKIQKS